MRGGDLRANAFGVLLLLALLAAKRCAGVSFSFSPLGVCRYPKASVPQALEKACCMSYVSAIWWSLTPDDERSCVVWSYVRQSRLVIEAECLV